MQTEQFQLHAEIEQRHWWFVARRRIMRQIVREVLPPSPETVVLDVGCGTGANIAALAADYRGVGIDASAEAIELAKRRFSRGEFVCGRAPDDVSGLMPDVRMVLLMDVLEHVSDDAGLLGSLVKQTVPGTYFLLTVPANPRLWSQHDVAFGHYRRYEPQALSRVWDELPLSLCFTSYFNTRLYPLVKLVRTINRWRGETAGEASTDFHVPVPPVNSMLERIFAGEASRLTRALHAGGGGYRTGVSLMALLKRDLSTLRVPGAE